jgi:hypothetical protein
MAAGYRHAGKQTAKNAMSDNEFRGSSMLSGYCMIGGGGQRQQHRIFALALGDIGNANGGRNQTARGTAKQAAHIRIAIGARDKHTLADARFDAGARINHAANGFISRHQRIPHARKRRHAPIPEQALGASADSAELHVDHQIIRSRWNQRHPIERKLEGRFQDYGERIHWGLAFLRRNCSAQMCQ